MVEERSKQIISIKALLNDVQFDLVNNQQVITYNHQPFPSLIEITGRIQEQDQQETIDTENGYHNHAFFVQDVNDKKFKVKVFYNHSLQPALLLQQQSCIVCEHKLITPKIARLVGTLHTNQVGEGKKPIPFIKVNMIEIMNMEHYEAKLTFLATSIIISPSSTNNNTTQQDPKTYTKPEDVLGYLGTKETGFTLDELEHDLSKEKQISRIIIEKFLTQLISQGKVILDDDEQHYIKQF